MQYEIGHDDKRTNGADIFSDIDAVESVLIFIPSSETICIVGGLAIKPHGSEEMKNLQSFLHKMAENKVEVIELNKGMVCADGLVRNDQFDFTLGYEECSYVKEIRSAVPEMHLALVLYMISPGANVTTDPTRFDHNHYLQLDDSVEKIQVRFTVGFAQYQADRIDAIRVKGPIRVPSFSYKQFRSVPVQI